MPHNEEESHDMGNKDSKGTGTPGGTPNYPGRDGGRMALRRHRKASKRQRTGWARLGSSLHFQDGLSDDRFS